MYNAIFPILFHIHPSLLDKNHAWNHTVYLRPTKYFATPGHSFIYQSQHAGKVPVALPEVWSWRRRGASIFPPSIGSAFVLSTGLVSKVDVISTCVAQKVHHFCYPLVCCRDLLAKACIIPEQCPCPANVAWLTLVIGLTLSGVTFPGS